MIEIPVLKLFSRSSTFFTLSFEFLYNSIYCDLLTDCIFWNTTLCWRRKKKKISSWQNLSIFSWTCVTKLWKKKQILIRSRFLDKCAHQFFQLMLIWMGVVFEENEKLSSHNVFFFERNLLILEVTIRYLNTSR